MKKKKKSIEEFGNKKKLARVNTINKHFLLYYIQRFDTRGLQHRADLLDCTDSFFLPTELTTTTTTTTTYILVVALLLVKSHNIEQPFYVREIK